MKAEVEELFQAGVVSGTHGLQGDLKVRPISAGSSGLLDAPQVFLRVGAGETRCYHLVRAVPYKKGTVLLRLQNLDSLEAVQDLVGAEVLLRYADLAELEEEEFYWFQLQGLSVVDRTMGELGILEDLFTTAAHDIYVVKGPYGEVLIPAVDEFVREVDLEGHRMVVDLPEGLVRKQDEV
jgi:16S rRNA processing protein RimM